MNYSFTPPTSNTPHEVMIKQDEIPHWEYLCKTFEGNLTLKEAWGSIYWQAFPFGLPNNFPLSSGFLCWALGRSCGILWYIENTKQGNAKMSFTNWNESWKISLGILSKGKVWALASSNSKIKLMINLKRNVGRMRLDVLK